MRCSERAKENTQKEGHKRVGQGSVCLTCARFHGQGRTQQRSTYTPKERWSGAVSMRASLRGGMILWYAHEPGWVRSPDRPKFDVVTPCFCHRQREVSRLWRGCEVAVAALALAYCLLAPRETVSDFVAFTILAIVLLSFRHKVGLVQPEAQPPGPLEWTLAGVSIFAVAGLWGYGISSGQATFSPGRSSTVSMKLEAAVRDSKVPVSNQAYPLPIISTERASCSK